MSLAGLLSVITDDPQFRQVSGLAAADSDGGYPGDGADVTAPSALRPLLAAALTGLPGTASRFLLAVTATAQGGRGTGRGARLAAARRRRGLLPRLGDAPA